MVDKLLNESEKPGKLHFRILFISWAGWVFDFYDLILFSFLLLPIGQELHFSNLQLSYVMGTSLAATAIGGVIFGILSDKYGRKTMLQLTIVTYLRFLQESGFGSSRKQKGKGLKFNIQYYFSVPVPVSRSGCFGIITAGLFNASFRFSFRYFISSLTAFS